MRQHAQDSAEQGIQCPHCAHQHTDLSAEILDDMARPAGRVKMIECTECGATFGACQAQQGLTAIKMFQSVRNCRVA